MVQILSLIAMLLVGLGWSTQASAQSLGEIARQAEARRKQAAPGKTYTNDNLPAAPATASAPDAPTTSGGVAPATGGTASSGSGEGKKPAGAPDASGSPESAAPRGREKRDEAYWRNRTAELQGKIDRTRSEISQVDGRYKELTSLQETSPSAAYARERETTGELLSRLQKDLEFQTRELEHFRQKARSAKVPPEWTN